MVRFGLSRNLKLILLILIATLLLLVPLVVRYKYYQNSLIGDEAYYHIRAAEALNKKIGTDQMSFYDKKFYLTPYDFIISLNIDFTSRFLSPLLGMITIILFYLILQNFRIDEEKRFYMVLIFIFSPIFLYTFSTLTYFGLSIFLLSLGFYLFIQKNKIISYSSTIPFLIASFNIFNSLLIFIMLISYVVSKKEKISNFCIISILMALVNIILKNPFMQHYFIIDTTKIEFLFSEFGAIAGFSVFQIFLALSGIFLIGKNKLKYFYPISLFFIFSFFFAPETIFYANIIVSFFAGEGFFRIINSKWKIEMMKDLMLMVLISGILFSQISYLKILITSSPQNDELSSLIWLKENTPQDAIVISHHSNSFLIQHIAKRKTVYDPLSPNFNETLNDLDALYYTRNIEKAEKILNRYNSTYFWINKKMKEKIWKEDDEGLLFLFSNSKRFKEVYKSENVEIWRYE